MCCCEVTTRAGHLAAVTSFTAKTAELTVSPPLVDSKSVKGGHSLSRRGRYDVAYT